MFAFCVGFIVGSFFGIFTVCLLLANGGED